MKETKVIGNPKMLSKEVRAIASYGLVDTLTNKANSLPRTTEKLNNVIEASYKLNDKYFKNFVFTYLKVNNITLEQLKQNIHNKTSDLTKSQREFVLNNL